jgi:hypothetical protein
MGGFAAFLLATAGIMVQAQENLEALQADDECSTTGNGGCALEALQRQAEILNESVASSGEGHYDDRIGCADYTGGTCNLMKCNIERNAVCERNILAHYCNCPKGSCASIDGNCYHGKTSHLVGTYVLKNAEYQNRYMTFDTVNHGVFAGQGHGPKGGEGWMKLHRMTRSSSGSAEFMISSQAYDNYAVYAGDVQKCKNKKQKKGESDVPKCKINDGVNSNYVGNIPKVEELFFIKPAYNDPYAIMIESVNIPGCFLTMKNNKRQEGHQNEPNMKVECTKGGNPDRKSFWYPDPPLPPSVFAR